MLRATVSPLEEDIQRSGWRCFLCGIHLKRIPSEHPAAPGIAMAVPVNGTRKRLTVARPRVIRQNVAGCKTVSLAEEVPYRKPKGVRVADNHLGQRSGKATLFRTGEVCQLARFGGTSVAGYEGDLMAAYTWSSAPRRRSNVLIGLRQCCLWQVTKIFWRYL
jgi:hypothetical protein